MMLNVRRAAQRGHADHGWLDSYHTFSFASYRNPQQMGFRSLRVINEDRVAPGQGFGMHEHRDMEIVSYVLAGALQHRDSMGNGAVLRPGEFQRISAGSGISHSEFNPSETEPVHFYQIWLFPDRKGTEPSYEQRAFARADRQNRWQLVASGDAQGETLRIQQDARIYLAELEVGAELTRDLDSARHAWLQVLRGSVTLGGETLHAGDGVAISELASLALTGMESAELMLFDLA
jgi:redox-sensitive bicupin YhaK (pirin superfamily)